MRASARLERVMHRMDVEPSLIGDLLEQHRSGRSTWWLWRQALSAIVIGNAVTIWQHKLIALRAIAVTWIIWTLGKMAAAPIIEALRWPYGVRVSNYLLVSGHEMLHWYFVHYQLYDLPIPVTQSAGLALASWVVKRTHRSHQAAMVLLVTIYVNLLLAYSVANMIRFHLLVRPELRWMFYPYLLGFLLAGPSMLIAGLGSKDRGSDSPDSSGS